MNSKSLLILAVLCGAGGRVSTEVNLLPQGNFDPGVNTVEPRLVAQSPLGDGVLPEGVTLDWDKTSVKTLNAKRAQVSLDGVWRFTPAAEGAAEPPTLG